MITFGWNRQQTLGDRFDDARAATQLTMGSVLLARSFQALMVVLRAYGDSLGRQFVVPRTVKNLAAFAAASRKANPAIRTAPITPKQRRRSLPSRYDCTWARDFPHSGKNIDLLGELSMQGKLKCRGTLVFYWPQNAIDAGRTPIVLSLVSVMVGRKKMFLLTTKSSPPIVTVCPGE